MSLSTEDLAEIRREVLEFKAGQRERNPKTVAEELAGASEVLQRLSNRFGNETWSAVNAVLIHEKRQAGLR